MLKVESIQNGIVIDHITAGKGMEIYRLLDLEASSQSVALLKNVKSRKYGTKDLIKIEGTTVPSRLDILGYLDDKISLIYIQNGTVDKKVHPVPPKELKNVIRVRIPAVLPVLRQTAITSSVCPPPESTDVFTVIRKFI